MHRLRRRRVVGRLVGRDELERDAVDLGVLGLEQAVVHGVGASAQAAADHLLAQELAAERAHAEDVGDGVGVPALGEHRDRDDAADLLAELAPLADGVHHLAQQVLVGQLRRRRGRGCAGDTRP